MHRGTDKYMCIICSADAHTTSIREKEPYIAEKRPCITPKETHVAAKES